MVSLEEKIGNSPREQIIALLDECGQGNRIPYEEAKPFFAFLRKKRIGSRRLSNASGMAMSTVARMYRGEERGKRVISVPGKVLEAILNFVDHPGGNIDLSNRILNEKAMPFVDCYVVYTGQSGNRVAGLLASEFGVSIGAAREWIYKNYSKTTPVEVVDFFKERLRELGIDTMGKIREILALTEPVRVPLSEVKYIFDMYALFKGIANERIFDELEKLGLKRHSLRTYFGSPSQYDSKRKIPRKIKDYLVGSLFEGDAGNAVNQNLLRNLMATKPFFDKYVEISGLKRIDALRKLWEEIGCGVRQELTTAERFVGFLEVYLVSGNSGIRSKLRFNPKKVYEIGDIAFLSYPDYECFSAVTKTESYNDALNIVTFKLDDYGRLSRLIGAKPPASL